MSIQLMRTLYLGLRLFALSGFILLSTIASGQGNYRPGVLHVKFKKELSQQVAGMRVSQTSRGTAITGMSAVDRISAARGVRKFKRIFREAGNYEAAHRAFGLHLWYEIEYDTTFTAGQVKADYEGTNQFERVEQPRKVHQIAPAFSPTPVPETPLTTNDPLFGDQWHYQNTGQTGGKVGADISLVPAWTLETGSNQVIVAVIDGGIDVLHPDLAAAVWVNNDEIPANGIDDDLNGYIDDVNGYGFGDNTGTIHPNFHGTHVAGTIGAVTNNGVGVSGIAGGTGSGNGVRLMSCAGFGLVGTGGFEDAMVYAADNGAVISQNSWGGGSTAIEAAIDYFIARAGLDNSAAKFSLNIQTGPMRGGIVIFAAGNSNTDIPSIGYPGSYPPVMAVASTDHNDIRSSFSNYGNWVDIAAPGSAVFSTYPVSLGSYALLSGTSMACPHVSGAAALIISKFKGSGFVPAQVWGRLQETADNIDAENPSYIGLLGSGRLNAFNALQSDDGVAPAPITDLTVSDELLTSIRLTWTATGGSELVGAASYYDLRYSTSPITEGNFAAATRVASSPKPKVSGSTEVFEVSGLLPTTTYYFAIKAGDYFGNLSGISNVVSGTTPEPPIIGVSPSSLSKTLFAGGVETAVLTIRNTGASNLTFDISVQPIISSSVPSTTASNGRVVAGLKLPGVTASQAYRDLAVWQSAEQRAQVTPASGPFPAAAGRIFILTSSTQIAELSPVNGAVIHTIPTPEEASGGPDGLAFDGRYLYFVNSFGTSTLYRIDPADGSVEGTLSLPAIGSIDALGHSGTHLYALNYSNATIYEIDFDARVVVRSITPGVGVGGGLSFGGSRGTLFASNFSSAIYEINLLTGAVVNTITPTGSIYGLGFSAGAGLLFAQNVSSGTTEAYDPETGAVVFSFPTGFSSAMASDEGGNQWLKIGEGSMVAAGQSLDVLITFDSRGLNGGDYLSNILVKSNDPVTPLVTVPASLHVDGAPSISLTPKALEFGNVIMGTHASRTVEIVSDGTDGLTITNLVMSNPAFSIEDSPTLPLSLAPGGKRTLTIRFTSTVAAEAAGTLSIHSNDPDQAVLALPLHAIGIEAPVIQVTPASITSDLYTGETEDHLLMVHNPGGSTLSIQVDVEFAELAPSVSHTVQPKISNQPNNHGTVVASGTPGHYPLLEGDFSRLANTPVPLTCFTIDPTTQYLYGQRNGGNQFYRYDVRANTWTPLTSSPVASGNNGGAAYLDGKIYTTYIGRTEMGVYSIATDTWTTLTAPFTTGNIASDGTYLYAVVGSDFRRYDPSSGTWSSMASALFSFEPWGALVYNAGKIYGHQGNGLTGFAEYTIATNTWKLLPSLPSGAVLGATIDPVQKNYYAYGSYSGNNLYVYNIPSNTWSIVPIPLFAINDGGMAYVKKPGKRGVYFLRGESGLEFAKFETKSADWLTLEPASADVGAGETLTLNARIDAAGLVSGEYPATIKILSNDPVNSLVSVPVTLTVTGAPNLSVNPIAMEFGSVFLGGERSLDLTLQNEGTDLLTITSVSSDSPLFTVGTPVASLAPGKKDTLTVTFRPASIGSFTGRITIQTNDPGKPEVHVELSGQGAAAPVIEVAPGAIASHLFVNESEDRTLTIHNAGESPLNIDLLVEVELPASTPAPSAIGHVIPNASPGINNVGLPEASAPTRPVPLAPGDFTALAPSPVALTCMTIDPGTQKIYAQQNGGTGFYTYTVETNTWTSLASSPLYSGNNGGAVFLNGKIYTVYTEHSQMGIYTVSTNSWTTVSTPTATANIATNGVYIYTVVSNQLYRYDPVGGSWTLMESPPFYFQSWGALVHHNGVLYGHQGNGGTGFAMYTIATNSWVNLPTLPSGAVLGGAIDPLNQVYYAYGSYGGTNLYAFDLTASTWSTTTLPFTINDGGMVYVKKPGRRGIYFIQGELGTGFAKFETSAGIKWLVLGTTTATVGVGTSVDIAVQLKATGLVGGEYSTAIQIHNNDPVTPLVLVPVTLTVTGAPDLLVSPIALEFGNVFLGGEGSYDLTLQNEGTDLLTFASVSSDSPLFTVGTPVASLAPGKQDTITVTFRPTSVGPVTGKIAIQTNDPVKPVVYVELSGQGVVAPAIEVTPDAIASSLFVNESEDSPMTVHNAGGSLLNFEIDVEYLASPPLPGSVETVVPNASLGINNAGLPEASAPTRPVPLAPGDFTALAPSPVALTCMTIDPDTQKIYAQQNNGTGFYTYTVETNTWTSLASSPLYSGNNGGAVFLNGKIYTVYTDQFQMGIYTVSTNSWTTISTPTATANIATNGVYIYTVVSNQLHRYDPVGGSWTLMASPPFYFQSWGALVHHNGVLYGHQGNGTYGFAKYTIATNSWVDLPTLPSGAVLGGAIDPLNKVYYAYGSYGGTNLYAFDLTASTWSTTTLPFTINDGGMAYVKKPGHRGIYFIQGEIGTGFAKFEKSNGSWLDLNPGPYILDAGATLGLFAKLNATGLVGGEYSAMIHLYSNDPITPLVSVPVTLTVTGAPDLLVTPSSMYFGAVYVGGMASGGLTLENIGTDVLTITSVTSESPLFTVSTPVPSLSPGGQTTLAVSFRPTSFGLVTSRVAIQTNDPDIPLMHVSVSGVGTPPPIISVTPSPLTETLLRGDKVTRMLTIRNQGNSDLIFGDAIEFHSAEPWPKSPGYGGKVSSGVKPSGHPGADPYERPSSWVRSAPQPSSSPSPATAGRLFMLGDPNTIVELSTTNGSVLATLATPEPASGGADGLAFDGTYLYFVNSSGTQKFYQLDPRTGRVMLQRNFPTIQPIDALAHNGTYLYALNYNSGTIYEIDFEAGTVVRSLTPGTALGGGMSFGGRRGTLFVSYFSSAIYEISIANGSIVKTIIPHGSIYGLGYSEGSGLLYAQNVSTNRTDAYDPNTGTLVNSFTTGYSSALASDEGLVPPWLTIRGGSMVAAGQYIQLPVDFDATRLAPGEYTASIVFTSNDPIRPEVLVPVTLTVTIPTGIEPEPVVDLILSPNPASQELHATFTLDAQEQVKYSLTDLTGRTLWTVSETRESGRQTVTASVASLPEGMYLFQLASRGHVITQRVVVLRK